MMRKASDETRLTFPKPNFTTKNKREKNLGVPTILVRKEVQSVPVTFLSKRVTSTMSTDIDGMFTFSAAEAVSIEAA